MAFAAVLLTLLDIEGGGIHWRGQSSEGKTTVLLVAASVWGEPGRLERWRATSNGLEGVASYHNDSLLLLDELREVDPKEAGVVAYMLSNGAGKRRGRPEGGSRPRLTWRLLFLSSVEISLETHVAHAGQRVHAGQDVRLVDLPAVAGNGHGVFEDLHTHANGQVFADCLKRHAAEAYGTAGRAFLTELVKDIALAKAEARQVIDRFVQPPVVPTGASGQVRRVAQRFGVIAAAGELATAYGVTGWNPGEATQAAKTCFEAWVTQRGGHTSGDEERALGQVYLFFQRYGEARFTLWGADAAAQPTPTPPPPPPCPKCHGSGMYGTTGTCHACNGTGEAQPTKDDPGMRVYDRAGFRRLTADGRTEYYVLREVFRREIAKDYDPNWLADLLVTKGLLLPNAQGKTTRSERLPGLGHERVYRFTPDITGAA
jgi:uncharacterized protein (DUF927 family)